MIVPIAAGLLTTFRAAPGVERSHAPRRVTAAGVPPAKLCKARAGDARACNGTSNYREMGISCPVSKFFCASWHARAIGMRPRTGSRRVATRANSLTIGAKKTADTLFVASAAERAVTLCGVPVSVIVCACGSRFKTNGSDEQKDRRHGYASAAIPNSGHQKRTALAILVRRRSMIQGNIKKPPTLERPASAA